MAEPSRRRTRATHSRPQVPQPQFEDVTCFSARWWAAGGWSGRSPEKRDQQRGLEGLFHSREEDSLVKKPSAALKDIGVVKVLEGVGRYAVNTCRMY